MPELDSSDLFPGAPPATLVGERALGWGLDVPEEAETALVSRWVMKVYTTKLPLSWMGIFIQDPLRLPGNGYARTGEIEFTLHNLYAGVDDQDILDPTEYPFSVEHPAIFRFEIGRLNRTKMSAFGSIMASYLIKSEMAPVRANAQVWENMAAIALRDLRTLH